MLRAADEFAHNFDAVPVHLVICVELDALAITDQMLDRPSIVGGASVYPFVQNILLGLRAEGLGAAFTTLLAPSEPAVKSCSGSPTESPSPGTSRSATEPTRGRSGCRASRCPSSPSASATGRTGKRPALGPV